MRRMYWHSSSYQTKAITASVYSDIRSIASSHYTYILSSSFLQIWHQQNLPVIFELIVPIRRRYGPWGSSEEIRNDACYSQVIWYLLTILFSSTRIWSINIMGKKDPSIICFWSKSENQRQTQFTMSTNASRISPVYFKIIQLIYFLLIRMKIWLKPWKGFLGFIVTKCNLINTNYLRL